MPNKFVTPLLVWSSIDDVSFLNDVISNARNPLHSGTVVKYGSFGGSTLFKAEDSKESPLTFDLVSQ